MNRSNRDEHDYIKTMQLLGGVAAALLRIYYALGDTRAPKQAIKTGDVTAGYDFIIFIRRRKQIAAKAMQPTVNIIHVTCR